MEKNNGRPYRLGIDVGSNSLGWFAVWLNEKNEPVELGPGGVRIYSDGRDPKSKESNAADRRVARGMRRRRDRYLKRRGNLMGLLVKHGLMPQEEAARKALEKLDPYELRAKALDGALSAHHVGRALFHMNQRRGFQSNRKTEKGDKESGAIKTAASKLEEAMQVSGARTLGEFLHRRHQVREPVRTRNTGAGAKAEYDFYPTRQMFKDEFDAIWKAQAPHHASMTEQAKAEIGDPERKGTPEQTASFLYQRPLKQPQVGKCSLDPAKDKDDLEGFRCSWAHPLAQRFRIWGEVRNLVVVETGKPEQRLIKEQADNIARLLISNGKGITQKGELAFEKIRTMLGLPPGKSFKNQSEKKDHLKGDLTAAKLSEKKFFGKAWHDFSLENQCAIVEKLEDEKADDSDVITWLVSHAGLDHETASRVITANLPEGHCRLGLRAIKKILPFMESGMNYPDAAKAAGYDHALLPDGELSLNGYLPYYGEWLQDDVLGSGDPRDTLDKRWGRFPNPTVHIGLGQLRRVVNALIAEHGPPTEIAVEMTRAFKLSPKKLAELDKEQIANQHKNKRRAEDIQKLGQVVNHGNLLKLRLWEEQNLRDPLDRRCPYTGEVIGIERLLSEETDIDHLIPFQDSYDDSASNKVVCMRYANRDKGKRTPFEAFGKNTGKPYDWEAISLRAALLPGGKRWRFDPDAREHFEKIGGFQARQLNETGWLARMAKQYLTAVTGPYQIHVLPGKLTAMIRAKWGLNELLSDHNYNDRGKNRKDHRHHAIDALVAACTDRSLLHRMSSAYDDERQKIDVPLPWPTLRDDLDAKLKAITVSHKPDHGLQARLFKDGAFGAVKRPDEELANNQKYLARVGAQASAKSRKAETACNLVYRKTFVSLNESEIERIRDIRLRELVRKYVQSQQPIDLPAALKSFSERTDIPGLPHGIRHVRLVEIKDPEYMIPVRRKNGAVYKSYFGGENAFVEVFETTDGQWRGEAMLVFTANQKDAELGWRRQYADAHFIMRIHKGDLIALDYNGLRTVMIVRQLDASANRFKLAPHNEAGQLQDRHEKKKDEYKGDPFRWLMASYNTLKAMKAERVRVDELGRLWRVKPEEAARTL